MLRKSGDRGQLLAAVPDGWSFVAEGEPSLGVLAREDAVQLLQLPAHGIQGAGKLGEVHLHLPELRGDVGRGGVEGAGEGLILGTEALRHPAKPGLGVGFQLCGALLGLAFNVADAVAELHIGLGVLPEAVGLRAEGLVLLRVVPEGGDLLQQFLRLGAELGEGGGLNIRLGAEAAVLSLQMGGLLLQGGVLLLQGGQGRAVFLGKLLNIVGHVLLVEAAEGDGLKGVAFHRLPAFSGTAWGGSGGISVVSVI